jgi:hypothetical protein
MGFRKKYRWNIVDCHFKLEIEHPESSPTNKQTVTYIHAYVGLLMATEIKLIFSLGRYKPLEFSQP